MWVSRCQTRRTQLARHARQQRGTHNDGRRGRTGWLRVAGCLCRRRHSTRVWRDWRARIRRMVAKNLPNATRAVLATVRGSRWHGTMHIEWRVLQPTTRAPVRQQGVAGTYPPYLVAGCRSSGWYQNCCIKTQLIKHLPTPFTTTGSQGSGYAANLQQYGEECIYVIAWWWVPPSPCRGRRSCQLTQTRYLTQSAMSTCCCQCTPHLRSCAHVVYPTPTRERAACVPCIPGCHCPSFLSAWQQHRSAHE